MSNTNEQKNPYGRELVTSRIYNAPRELVYRMWTEPEHIVKWWGPDGFTNNIHEMDVKPGGVWRLDMIGPDGTSWPNKIEYQEVVKPERLVYIHGSGKENDPEVFHVTVNFEDLGEKTLLTIRTVFASPEALQKVIKEYGALEGNRQTFDHLKQYLASLPEYPGNIDDYLLINRTVNAPMDLVYKVWTQPEHLEKWWGPAGMKLEVKKFELKPGGLFVYSMEAPDGNKMWGRFQYREINPPLGLTFVSSFTDEDGNIMRAPFSANWPMEILNLLSFMEKDGKTHIRLEGGPINATLEERKQFAGFKDNMNQGFAGTFKQLEEYLASISVETEA
jgi:uncharacterized protein YndB with AHSA1/START domain